MPTAVFSKSTAMTDAPSSSGGVLATRIRFSGESGEYASFLLARDEASVYGNFEPNFSPATGGNKFFVLDLAPVIGGTPYDYIATSDPTEFSPDIWYSVFVKFITDSAAPFYPLEVWINGVQITMDILDWDGTAQVIDWSLFDSWEFGNLYGTEIVDSRFIWFDPAPPANPVYSDFFEVSGCVKDLGADGSTPTGSQPMVYMTGGATEYQQNKGYGGTIPDSAGSISDGTYTCP